MRSYSVASGLVLAFVLGTTLTAADREPDFSGKWTLDRAASKLTQIGDVDSALSISHTDAGILVTAGSARWSYSLDGSENRRRIGDETRDSSAKWEGTALLINTVVSGPRNYSVADRWNLSRDRNTLSIARQVIDPGRQLEGTLVYRREGTSAPAPAQSPTANVSRPATPASPAPPTLVKRGEPALDPDVTVPNGTRMLLSLVGEVSTKRAKDGDRVYLRTAAPVAAGGRVVIPAGSNVEGSITHTKPAGKVKGKGELFIRFDSLILPNGVSRDFHARPSGDEGKVGGDGKAADGRTVLTGAGMGATIGAITRGLGGAAVGGGIGALAGVLLSRNQDVVLRPGTTLEMVLDRDLVFHPDELAGLR